MKDSRRVLALTVLLLGFPIPTFCQLQKAKTFVYINNVVCPQFVQQNPPQNSVSVFDGDLHPATDSNGTNLGPYLTGGFGACGGAIGPTRIVIAGQGQKYLYVTNDGSGTITTFRIELNGGLTPIGIPVVVGQPGCTLSTCFLSLAASQAGDFLYAANNSQIYAYSVGAGGTLTPNGGSQPYYVAEQSQMKISPNGKYLGIANGGNITLFSLTNGVLGAQHSSSIAGQNPEFNCGSNLLFGTSFSGNGTSFFGSLNVLQIAMDGSLSVVSGSPYPYPGTNVISTSTLLAPDDLHVFLGAYSPTGTSPTSIASVDVIAGGSGNVVERNQASSLNTQNLITGIATDQTGSKLYVARVPNFIINTSLKGNSIYVYDINPNDGSLSPPVSPLPASAPLDDFALLPSVAVFPPKTCFGNLAARQAQTDISGPGWTGQYGYGGKGFDYGSSSGRCSFPGQATAPCWITPSAINDETNGYIYFAQNTGSVSGPPSQCMGVGNAVCKDLDGKDEISGGKYRDFGMDCSGLIMWSYNTAVNATTQVSGNPAPSPLLPISYEGAGQPGQCSTAQSRFLTKDLSVAPGMSYHAPLDLRPGDLLCFTYKLNNTPVGSHVAMYLGGQANQTGQDTIEDYFRSSIPAHNGVVIGNVNTRPFTDVAGLTNCSSSVPTSECFDFDGYWRPKEPQIAIFWQAHSPVSLVVTDPDGNTIDPTKWTRTEHEAYRAAGDLLYNDYSPTGDDIVFSPTLKTGVYVARVVPKPGAAPTDTYSLTVTAADTTITLAENVPISAIPSQGYAVASTGTTISVPQGDTIPPTTTSTLSPQPNVSGWNNTNVTVTLSSTDNEPGGSGVKQITYSATGAQTLASTTVNASSVPILISSEGTTTITFFGTDNAGNVENPKQVVVMLDKTLPSVSCGAPDGLWHASDVNIPCTASDVGSGLANPPDASFSLSTRVLAGTETSNAATGTRAVCDVAGNCATAGPVTGNKVDEKPPTISVSSPTAGGSYLLNQAVNANYTCTDAGSGVATCTGTVASGSLIGTALVGSKTFTVNATDNVGNVAPPQSVSYSVTYAVCLLYDPTRAVQSGSTIPLKIQLCDTNNADVSSSTVVVHGVSLVQTSTNASEVLQSSGNANPDNDFRFDPTLGPTGGYIFNLSTQGLTTGSYLLTFSAGTDPLTHTLNFQVR